LLSPIRQFEDPMKAPQGMLLLSLISLAQAEEKASAVNPFELPEVEVVGVTPLGDTGLPREKVSSNVQSVEDEDMQRHESLNFADYMRREMPGVTVNDAQNNPYQPDISYHGYLASPLMGTPIGLSVYQDGVRVNEAFGDTVNWDLIPQFAIANLDLIPGSNPLFGLNTLGGALSLRTKSGFSHPGSRAQLYGGSFGRKAFEAEHGGSKGKFDWYLAGNLFEDDGWRPYTHSAVHQAFGKLGWEDADTDLDFSFTFADNQLNGIGPVPDSFYSRSRRALFTAKDNTENTLYFFNLKGSHHFSEHWSLSGNTYYRANTQTSLNSNTSEDCDSLADCPSAPASNVRGHSVQDGSGVNLQLTSTHPILERDNQVTVGGGFNGGHTHFTQSEQQAFIDARQVVVGTSPFLPGTDVKGENDYFNAFLTDTFSPMRWLHLNGSFGWNRAEVRLLDRIGTDLNGSHSFERFNPSAGFTLEPLKALGFPTPLQDLTVYANYNEGFRAPSPVELACADRDAPCSLPNSFVADPPLQPVVSKTFEAGLRGKLDERLRWSLGLFHARNENDILFINSSGSNQTGYFQNVGVTQRQGGELGLGGQWQKLNWSLSYSFVDATYRTPVILNSALGPVPVRRGDRMPGIPQQTVKLGAEYQILPGWFLGGDLLYASSQYARGDDSNRHAPVEEYVVVNLNTRYQITPNAEVFAMARNVFDARYETFGVMNNNFFTGQPERFVGPGAPIGGWAGIRLRFD